MDNICGSDLANMQLNLILLCVIDIFSTYEKVIFLEDENGETITKVFQKILEESYRKSNKIWGDKGSELYNRSIKSVSR